VKKAQMAKANIVLFTSIPPRITRFIHGQDFGPQWQVTCIQSWIDAGLQVVSLNTPEEINALRSFSQSIAFREIPKGRERPLITDFFAAAKRYENEIVGIINADCMILPQSGIAKRLCEFLTDDLVVAERVNLDQSSLRLTHMSQGFDAFFFKAGAISRIKQDDHWRIGDVWYDFWLPLAFRAAGFNIKTLPVPALLHLNHDRVWNWSAWELEFARLIDLVRSDNDGRFDPELAGELLGVVKPSADDVHRLSKLLYLWLSFCEPLRRPTVGVEAVRLANALASLNYPSANRYHGILGRARVLKWIVAAFGRRRALYMLGLSIAPHRAGHTAVHSPRRGTS
jgi:hypothetical protein